MGRPRLRNWIICSEHKGGMNLYLYLYDSKTLATWCEELNHWKRPWYWERLKAGGEGATEDGWMASLDLMDMSLSKLWELVMDQQGSQRSLACCSSWGHKELDMTEQLKWKLMWVPRSPHWDSLVISVSCGWCYFLPATDLPSCPQWCHLSGPAK